MGWDMEDVLQNDRVLPLVVEQLEWDDRFGRQLFQSAYVGRVQEVILRPAEKWAKESCNKSCWICWNKIPSPMIPFPWSNWI